jgi:hypothetical protein
MYEPTLDMDGDRDELVEDPKAASPSLSVNHTILGSLAKLRLDAD